MSFATKVIRHTALGLLKVQVLMVAAISLLQWFVIDVAALYASLYGGFIVLLVTTLSAWRIERAGNSNSRQSVYREIYTAAIEKYFLTLALFALGLGWLKLSALSMLTTFILLQISYIFITVETDYRKLSPIDRP